MYSSKNYRECGCEGSSRRVQVDSGLLEGGGRRNNGVAARALRVFLVCHHVQQAHRTSRREHPRRCRGRRRQRQWRPLLFFVFALLSRPQRGGERYPRRRPLLGGLFLCSLQGGFDLVESANALVLDGREQLQFQATLHQWIQRRRVQISDRRFSSHRFAPVLRPLRLFPQLQTTKTKRNQIQIFKIQIHNREKEKQICCRKTDLQFEAFLPGGRCLQIEIQIGGGGGGGGGLGTRTEQVSGDENGRLVDELLLIPAGVEYSKQRTDICRHPHQNTTRISNEAVFI